MRFLSDLVSCCCITPRHMVVVPPNTPPQTAETRSLVPMSCVENNQHSKVAGRNLAAAAQWRPSLCTISEDDVVKVVVVERERGTSSARPSNKVVDKFGSKPKLPYYRHQVRYEASIPTFSPGAFIF